MKIWSPTQNVFLSTSKSDVMLSKKIRMKKKTQNPRNLKQKNFEKSAKKPLRFWQSNFATCRASTCRKQVPKKFEVQIPSQALQFANIHFLFSKKTWKRSLISFIACCSHLTSPYVFLIWFFRIICADLRPQGRPPLRGYGFAMNGHKKHARLFDFYG